jgi:RNA polymerase primary sigma factor
VSQHELLKHSRRSSSASARSRETRTPSQRLVRANLRFVISVAKKYQNRGVSLIDLIQEGNVGLVTAARKFDPEQGVKFISYAVWWIRQAILAALANQGRAVRVPLNRASDLARIFRERERLKQELRRDPTLEEVAEAASLTPEVVTSLSTLNAAEIRLDAPIGDSDDSQLVERFMWDEALSRRRRSRNGCSPSTSTGTGDADAARREGRAAVLRSRGRSRAHARGDRQHARRHARAGAPAA